MLKERAALIATLVVWLAFLISVYWFHSSRQTITVRVTNADVPVSGLILRLKVSGRHDCGPRSGIFYRSGSTDSAGIASWNRPIKRKWSRYRGRNDDKLFDFLNPRPRPGDEVLICANLEDQDRVIFVEDEGKRYERRLNVTCDLALNTSEKCYGTYPISLDRTLLPYVFLPLWVVLAVAIARSGGRPVGRDVAMAFGLLALAAFTGPLDQFWHLCQVLAVVATMGVFFALGSTLSANVRFRESNQG